MPKSTRSTKSRRTYTPPAPPTTATFEEPTVTATATAETEEATVRELPFTLEISPAPEGFTPDRSPAGRKRIPSPFEEIIPDLKGKGWQNQPHDGQVTPIDEAEDGTPKFNTTTSVKGSNAQAILRELAKAVKFKNTKEGGELNLGLDVNVTATDVQFNIRDKQKRKPKSAPGGGEVTDGELNDDSDSDNGDE